MLRVMYLPDDVRARVITVEEIMHYNLGAESWPTAEVVMLQLLVTACYFHVYS